MSDKMREALEDALSGWKYIREHHGDLYGVGWDRVQNKLEAALAQPQNDVQWHKKLADDLERLCCAETEGKFFDLVTDSIQTIVTALRRPSQPQNDAEAEPVAWRWRVKGDKSWTIVKQRPVLRTGTPAQFEIEIEPLFPAPPSPDRMREALENLIGSSEAFLNYFNPFQLSSDKENQWLSVHDDIGRAREALRAGDNHASDGKYDPAFVASIKEADAAEPEARFRTVEALIDHLDASDGKESEGGHRMREALVPIISALDRATGDTDAPYVETDEDYRDQYPVHWAMQKLNLLLQSLPSS